MRTHNSQQQQTQTKSISEHIFNFIRPDIRPKKLTANPVVELVWRATIIGIFGYFGLRAWIKAKKW